MEISSAGKLSLCSLAAVLGSPPEQTLKVEGERLVKNEGRNATGREALRSRLR